MLRNVYHHLTDPAAVLAGIGRALAADGVLLIIDFKPSVLLAPWTPEDLPADRDGHGIEPDIVMREATAAGFTRTALIDPWPAGGVLVDAFAVVLRGGE